MKYKDNDKKIAHAMKLFEDAVDHTDDSHEEAHRAERFYHNSEGEGQWEREDLAYLRDAGRPVLSFNMVKSKLDVFFGMYADAQRTPKVVGAGKEDELYARVVNTIKDQLCEAANYESLAARQLKTGTIAGECGLHPEFSPSEDGEGWIKLDIDRILPFELHWDIASIEPDRSDARYLFWNRWFDEQEFSSAYPDADISWDTLKEGGGGEGDNSRYSSSRDLGETFADSWSNRSTDYGGEEWNRYYFDRKKNKIRVIWYEYITNKTVYYLVEEDGSKTEIEKDKVERAELAEELGSPVRLIKKSEEVVEVCEFIGNTILAEHESAGPFKGFSVVSYCYDVDEETGTAYGPIRNLFDPQQEFNKAKSLSIEYLAQSTAPGVIAEEGSVPNTEAFSTQMRLPGGVAIVKKGALAGGQVQDRQPTQVSSAVMERMTGAQELMSEISGIPSAANLTAAEHQQAGITVAIRYNKSKQTVSTPFSHFERAQKNLISKIVEGALATMPDEQIAAMLGKEEDLIVQDGVVYEMMPSPDGSGQMVPKQQARLDGVSNFKWNLDMEYTSENSTLRMLEMDMLMQLVQAGVAVDPEVLVDHAVSGRASREKLKAFVEKSQASAAAGQQAQAEAMKQQAEQFVQVEMAKIQESNRHNMASEEMEKLASDAKTKLELLKLWESADENEKKRIKEMTEFAAKLTADSDTQEKGRIAQMAMSAAKLNQQQQPTEGM